MPEPWGKHDGPRPDLGEPEPVVGGTGGLEVGGTGEVREGDGQPAPAGAGVGEGVVEALGSVGGRVRPVVGDLDLVAQTRSPCRGTTADGAVGAPVVRSSRREVLPEAAEVAHREVDGRGCRCRPAGPAARAGRRREPPSARRSPPTRLPGRRRSREASRPRSRRAGQPNPGGMAAGGGDAEQDAAATRVADHRCDPPEGACRGHRVPSVRPPAESALQPASRLWRAMSTAA